VVAVAATVEVASVGCTEVDMAAVATAVEVVYPVVEATAAVDCTACADLAVAVADSKDQVVAHPIVAVDTVTRVSSFSCVKTSSECR
jgi:hypothetical protein